MPSIDNRVVNMRFENKNFQSGVADSIDSIDKLKSALDFKGADKGFRDVEQSINGASFEKVGKSVDDLANRFSTLGTIATSVLLNIGTDIYQLGKKLVTAIPKQIMSGGWSRAANIENARFQLKGLGIEWEQISKQIDFGVADTAYGLDAAAKVAAQLAASNVEFWTDPDYLPTEAAKAGEALDLMSRSLRGISGVAAMTNSTYEDIGGIFTAIAGAGKAANGELDRFAYRGLNVRATLADFINDVNSGTLDVEDYVLDAVDTFNAAFAKVSNAAEVTESDVRELASKGAISFDLFASAMDYAFGEHAKDANETFDGAFANMKAALSRIGADFATPIREGATDIFNAFRDMFNAVRKGDSRITDVTKQFGNWYGTMDLTDENGEFGFLYSFGEAVDFIVSRIRSIDLSWINDAVIAVDYLFSAIVNLFVTMGPIADAISAAWHSIIPEGIGDIAIRISQGIYKATEAIRSFFGIGSEDSDLLGDVEEIADAAETLAMTAEEIDHYANLVIQGAFGVLGGNPDRRAALEELGVSFEAVQNRVNELLGCSYRYEVAQGSIIETTEDLAAQLQNMGISYDMLPSEMQQYLRSLGKEEEAQVDLYSAVRDLGVSYAELPKSVRMALEATTVSTEATSDAAEETTEYGEKLQATSGLLSMVSGVISGIAGAVSILKEVALGVWNGVIKPVLRTAMRLLNPIFVTIGDLGRKLGDLATKLRENNTITNWFQGVATWIETAGQRIQEFIDKVKQLPQVQRLGEIWESIKQWFKDLDLGQKLSDLFGGAKKLLPTSETLLTVIDAIAGAFVWLIETGQKAWEGIKNFFSGIDFSGVTKLWEGIKTFFSGLNFSAVGNFFDSIFNSIADFFRALTGNKGLWTAIKDAFTSLWNGIVEFFGSIDIKKTGEALGNVFATVWEGFVSFIHSIDLNEVTEVIKTALDTLFNITIGMLLFRISRFFANLSQGLNGISHVLDASALLMTATAILEIAIAVGILATAMLLISFIPAEKMEFATEVLATFVLALIGLVAVIKTVTTVIKPLQAKGWLTAFNSFSGNAASVFNVRLLNLPNVAANILAVTAALGTIVYAFKTLYEIFSDANLDEGAVAAALGVIVGIMVAISATIIVVSGALNRIGNSGFFGSMTGGKVTAWTASFKAISGGFIAIGASILLMALAFKSLYGIFSDINLDEGAAMAALGVIAALMVLLSGIIAATHKTTGGRLAVTGAMFIMFAIGIGMLVPSLLALSLIHSGKIIAVGVALAILTTGFSAMIALAGQVQNAGESIAVILAFGVALGALGLAVASLAGTKWADLWPSLAAIGLLAALAVAIGILIAKFENFGKGMETVFKILTLLAASLALVGVAAVSFAGALKILSDSSINAKQAGKNLAEGIVAFFDALMEKGDSIIKFVATIVDIVIAIIVARKVHIVNAASSIVEKLLGWLGGTGKAKLILTIALILAAVVMFLNDAAGPVTSALVGIVVTIINSIALAIGENGSYLMAAIGNLAFMAGNLIVTTLVDIIRQIVRWFTPNTPWLDKIVEWLNNNQNRVMGLIRKNQEGTSDVIDRGAQALKDRGKSYLSSAERAADDIQKGQQKVAAAMEPTVTKNGAVVSTPVVTVDPFTDTGTGGKSTSGGAPTNAQGLTYKEWEEKVKTPLETEQKILQDMLEDGTLSKEKAVAYRARLKEIEEILTGGFTTYSDYIRQELGDPATEEALKTKKRRLLEMLDSDIVPEAKKDKIREQLRELRDIDIDDGETSSSYLSGFDFAEQLGSGITDGIAGFDVQSIFGEFSSDMLDYIGNMATEEREAYISNLDIPDEQKEVIRANWRSVLEEPEPEPATEPEEVDLPSPIYDIGSAGAYYDALPKEAKEAYDRFIAERQRQSSEILEGIESGSYGNLSAGGFWETILDPIIKGAKALWPEDWGEVVMSPDGYVIGFEDPTVDAPALEAGLETGLGDAIGSVEISPEAWQTTFDRLYKQAETSNDPKDWVSLGQFVQTGLQNGMLDNMDLPENAATLTGVELAKAIAVSLGIASPSKVTAEQGRYVDEGLALGIKESAGVVRSPIRYVINSMISILRSGRDKFYQIGRYLVQGLAQGMDSSKELAAIAARAVVRHAIEAGEDEGGIESPSKEFARLGMYSGMGYANGLLGMSSTAEDAARSVVMNSLDAVRDTISMLAAAIESDIEMDPTIRPVLDLSQLRAGASQANSLLTRTLSTVPDYARAARAGTEVNGMKATAARVKADQTGNFNSHIRELRADIHELKDAMGEMQMVMDTGAVVGAIQKPMDRALGNNMRFTNRRL